MPNATDDLFIPAGRTVCLDGDNAARTLIVEGTLTKEGGQPVTLQMSGNLLCRSAGVIRMPDRNNARWTIRFLVNSESQFVGRGDAVLASDTGLWAIQGCRLELDGALKTSWTRLGNQAMAGGTTINVLMATGWLVGDEIAIAPTEPATVSGFAAHFDERVITAISGVTVTLDRPLTWNHASVQVRPGVFYAAEVMNLSRTGVIEGRPNLRSHIWIMNDRPVAHRFANIVVRWMGPQQFDTHDAPPPGHLIDNLGRYPIHFHMNGNNSVGTLIESVVVRNFGMHAEVTHDSNGIMWRDTVMYDGYGDAQWWDHQGTQCDTCPRPTEPSGLQILHNIAANLKFIPSFRGFIMTGFFVGRQNGNIYRDNVATGVQGNVTCSGFEWPEFSHGVAVFDQGNLAHNNACTGLFAWQNDSAPHVIQGFTTYHNRFAGIEHGAYVNLYVYRDVTLYANGDLSGDSANIVLHAMSQPPAPADEGGALQLRFINVYMDAAGRPWNVMTAAHAVSGAQPVRFSGGTMIGATRANINLAATPSISGSLEDWLQVDADVAMTGNRYWLNDNISSNSRIVDLGLRLTLWRRDQSARCPNGVPRPDLNAWACPN